MISKSLVLATIGFAIAIPQGCEERVAATASKATAGDSGSQLEIVATTGMIGDLVRDVLGDRGDVVVLMGEDEGLGNHGGRSQNEAAVSRRANEGELAMHRLGGDGGPIFVAYAT